MRGKAILAVCGLLLVIAMALGGTNEVTLTSALAEAGTLDTYTRQGNLLILMYHDFAVEPPVDREQIELVSTGAKFAADIDELRALGYISISLEDYYYGHAEADKKYFAITFDDGYAGVYDIAYPVLQEKQATGAVFFNTGMAWTDGFLHYPQLREMEESGLVRVYSHLAYHIRSTKAPPEEFSSYLDASFRDLKQYLGERPLFLAYPYGNYNRDIYQTAEEHGVCLHFAQKRRFAATDILVRVNVPYDANMEKLVKRAEHN